MLFVVFGFFDDFGVCFFKPFGVWLVIFGVFAGVWWVVFERLVFCWWCVVVWWM